MRTRIIALALFALFTATTPAVAATPSPPCHDCYRAAAPIGSFSELVAYDADDARAIDQLLLDADALGITVREVYVTYVP